MIFFARIRRGSFLDETWRRRGQKDGKIHDVVFKLQHDRNDDERKTLSTFYESDELQTDEITAVKYDPMIELIAVAEPPLNLWRKKMNELKNDL